MSVEILELTPSQILFDKMLKEVEALYEASFPPEERRPFSEIVAGLGTQAEDRSRMLIALDGVGLLGLSIFRYLPTIRVGYLWYLCVSESARGRQVGTNLYKTTVGHLVKAGARALIFEVEPLSANVPAVYGDPKRRIQFYERLGARLVIGYEYIQPPIPPHGPVRLELMVHLLDGRTTCSGSELAEIIEGWLNYLERPHQRVPQAVRLGNITDLINSSNEQGPVA